MSAARPARGARYDCIVVGGGHNGLTCAAYLARAGRSVLVLEAADRVGGAAVTREFAPGFRVSACAHLLHLMPGKLIAELNLSAHGLKLAAAQLPTTALSADDAHLPLGPEGAAVLAAQSAHDAAAYPAYGARLARLAARLRPILGATPPRLGTAGWRDRAALLGLGL
ncbi:MAG TPA: FAD-dependent oxidoreductase, partial [Steroidobacteraceae bacterium]|nr:FAD-dependent oxidoreductase [Steroidobacteraceae bacterium]